MDKRRSYAEVVCGSGKSFLYNYLFAHLTVFDFHLASGGTFKLYNVS